MLLSALALLAAASTTPAAAVPAGRSYGPITATYFVKRDVYCIRSGWNAASRRVSGGACLSAEEWRRRGIAFDATHALAERRASRPAGPAQVAAR